MDLKQLTWSRVAMVVIMAVVPAVMSYCKASDEAETQAAHAAREADAGYKALVLSVKHLEQVVQAQGEAISLLTGQRFTVPLDAGVGSAGGPELPAAGSAAAAVEVRPHEFPELPTSNAEALRQQAAPL